MHIKRLTYYINACKEHSLHALIPTKHALDAFSSDSNLICLRVVVNIFELCLLLLPKCNNSMSIEKVLKLIYFGIKAICMLIRLVKISFYRFSFHGYFLGCT